MTPESQRIAIAEACGWKYPCLSCLPSMHWRTPSNDGCRSASDLPDYLNDLNAMHEAEKILQERCIFWPDYVDELAKMFPSARRDQRANWSQAIHATAAQRAEAFLHTIGKWEETPTP